MQSVTTYHTGVTERNAMSHMTGLASADRISIMSGASYRPSMAPSMMMHDYNGKKQKIIQTCRQIDDMKSGVVKAVVF